MVDRNGLAERVRNQALAGCAIFGIAGAAVLFGAAPFFFWQRSIDAPVRSFEAQRFSEARPIPAEERQRQEAEREAMRAEYERMKASGDRSAEFHSLKALFDPDSP